MEEKAATGAVRVATLNLWGRRGAGDERRRVLVAGFRRLRPDLVAFQEAVVGNGYDQVAELLGPRYHVAHHILVRCSAHGPTLDIRGCERIFDEPVNGVWAATTLASSRTSHPRRRADDLCSDRSRPV